jgi:DNA topoisomerase-1
MAKKNLVIVESPAKAKTIEKFLGKDFLVKSSFGHIRDLPKKGLNINVEKNYQPKYEIPADKKKVVTELRKLAEQSDQVWLASDEDREGEAIAWHLAEALKLDTAKTKRIVFHEITKPAITKAIENPRTIDINLVDAQQARRVLDRLVGYELSPILWKKVQPGLSAGRVQSVAVKLIVDKEREISNFESQSTYKTFGNFQADGHELSAELNEKFDSEDKANKFLEDNIDASYVIDGILKKPSERNPGAPFTTSTLQQEASRNLGFSVKQTMSVAQKLYENGHITYMRTDSLFVSNIAIAATGSYIESEFGKNYLKVRTYKTKNATAQEAHEAIRPTNISNLEAGADAQQQKLYKLIWKRMVASQMAPARTEKTEAYISISTRPEKFVGKGEVLLFDGFMKVYGGTKEDQLLPKLEQGQRLQRQEITSTESYTRHPSRYTEASLVRTLEELGIGRPSTYAPTISTIQTRGYIEKVDIEGEEKDVVELKLTNGSIEKKKTTEIYGADKSKLIPTHLADVATDFLAKYFAEIVDSSFTAQAEEEFDEVAEGKIKWQKAIDDFYTKFHPLVENAETVSRSESSQARELGNDPASGKPIFARYGKYGLMLQKGSTDSEEKPQFAPFPSNTRLESITLEEALEMFKLPRLVGHTKDGKEIKANIGRFGPYIQVDRTFVSTKPLGPFEVDEEKANELYEEKLKLEANRQIKEFAEEKIQVLRGPFGPYVTNGKVNARIPKAIEPEKISLLEANELLAKAKPAKKRIAKRKSTKK